VHPTADNIYELLKKDHPTLSLGTVYRNLHVLEKSGKIAHVYMPDGPDRYDAEMSVHYHSVCDSCGEVSDIFTGHSTEIEKIIHKIGSNIRSYSLTFNAVCDKCSSHKGGKE
jgi:Fur family peroxide stress response transcriptional regulator